VTVSVRCPKGRAEPAWPPLNPPLADKERDHGIKSGTTLYWVFTFILYSCVCILFLLCFFIIMNFAMCCFGVIRVAPERVVNK